MKYGLYPKLAWIGIVKNKKIYVPYVLTCIGMIMMFYIISFLANNHTVASISGGNTMQLILMLGSGIIGVFSAIFLFYTNSFLMRRRKKEFGLYNILGMGKRNLIQVLIWECLMIAGISITMGMGIGILFSKLGELLLIRILGGESDFSFQISGKSILDTLVLFGIIFLALLLNALRQIRLSNPVELLKSEAVGEKPPKANWILAVVGIALLSVGYYTAVTIEDPATALILFFGAAILVIIATYLLFVAGSVVFCRILQKNKRYYYKTSHFISISSMLYRMKRNGAGLASICILSTMVLVMISSTACLFFGTEDSLRNRYPRNIVVDTYSLDEEEVSQIQDVIWSVQKEYGEEENNVLNYQYISLAGFQKEDQFIINPDEIRRESALYENVKQIFIVPISDYNRLMGKEETLNSDEVLLYCTKSEYDMETIQLEGMERWKVKGKVPDFVDNGTDAMQVTASLFVFVPDLKKIQNSLLTNENLPYQEHNYYGFDLSCDDDKQIEMEREIDTDVSKIREEMEDFPKVSIEGVASERSSFYGLYGGLFFLGVLLGIVFIVGAVLIMYYKQVTEGYEDQDRFQILQKVGMTKKEIQKSINSQVLTVFFLPLLVAGIHICFAFPLVYRMLLLFNLTDIGFLIAITAISYLAFAIFYVIVYQITSRSYFSIVSGKKHDGD